jgi:hypothetical protein
MAASYIPPQEAAFVTWLLNFTSLIVGAPTTYGLTTADATALQTMTTTYNTAYNAAKAGGTRGPATIATKDAARANVTTYARQLATLIQANPAITSDQLTALGLTVRKTNKTPIPAPTSSPILTFIAATPLQQTIRFADQNTPAARTKPFGAIALQLVVTVTGGSTQQLQLTKNPVAINFGSGDAGKLATYTGKWQTRSGLLGPSSNTLSATVIGTGGA